MLAARAYPVRLCRTRRRGGAGRLLPDCGGNPRQPARGARTRRRTVDAALGRLRTGADRPVCARLSRLRYRRYGGGAVPPLRSAGAGLGNLEQAGGTHAAADAHRADDELGAAPLSFDQRVPDHPRPRHAIGMANRDRAAIDVQLVVRDAEPIAAIDDLAGEGLVQLPQIDVVYGQAVLFQQLRHGEDRADAHLVRGAAGDCYAAIDAERLQAAALGLLFLHQDRGRGAVRQLRGVAGGDMAPFLDPLAVLEDRLQPGEAFQVGVGPVALVLVDRDGPHRALARGAVCHLHDRRERHDLIVEAACLLCRGGALLRTQCEFVLRLARHLVAVGDDLEIGRAHV